MTDTVTPKLGLVLPEVGAEDGEDLWGEKLNTNFVILDQFAAVQGTLIEAPVDGYVYGRQGSTESWVAVTSTAESDAINAAQDAQIAATAFPEAPADGQLYSRKGSTTSWVVASAGAVVSDTPPVGVPLQTLWWNSSQGGLYIDYQDRDSRQWVMVNAPGMPEANKDGKPYARMNGAWFDLTATFAAAIDATELAAALAPYALITSVTPKADKSYVDAQLATKANASSLAAYLPLVGGTITGGLTVNSILTSGGELRTNSGILRLSADLNRYLYWDGSSYSLGGWGTIWTTGNLNPALYLPLAGGTLTGSLAINGSMSCATAMACTASGGNHAFVAIGSGAAGGVLGYPQGTAIYGALSYQGYGLYTPYALYVGQTGTFAGAISVGGNCIVTGVLTSTYAGNNTSTNSANCTIGTNGTFGRTTSSVAYKTDIELMEDEYADKVLLLEPIFYRPGPNTVDRQDWSRFGFSAEGAYAADFRFSYCEEGALISYEKITEEHPTDEWTWWNAQPEEQRGPEPVRNYIVERQGPAVYDDTVTPVQHDLNAIVAALLNVVKRQNARIAALEAASGV
jgi:hypothetical protein